MNWDDLRILYYVALRGSFLGAGQDLNMAPSTISRRISQLEEALSVTLLERGVEGCRLTAQGEEFAEIAKSMSGQLDRQLIMSRKGREGLSGTVILSSGEGFSEVLTTAIIKFSQDHPNCSVDYSINSDFEDVARGKVDVAIRTQNRGETSLIYKKIAEINFGFFTSPAYLKNNANKMSPEIVDYIDLLPPMDQAPHKQIAREAGFINARIRMSSFRSQFEAVSRGFGVASLPRILAQDALTEVFQDIPLPPMKVYLVTRPQALKQPHIRAFVDMIYTIFEKSR